jgi:phage gp29-like protein
MVSPYDSSPGQGKLKADLHILDAYGRPIIPELLNRELAFPTLTGVRNVWQDAIAPGLTPGSLAGLLEDAAQGNHYAYLTLAEEMEEKDLHYAAQIGTRKRAVVRLPLDVDAASESDQDVKIAEAVRELVESDIFRALLEEQLDALGKGYSVNEICWDRTGKLWTPETYKWRDPHFFQFDIVSKSRIRVRDTKNPAFGVALAPYKFIVHYPHLKCGIPLRGGLARLVAWSYLFKNYTIKDWISFLEVFGMPLRLGRYDANTVTEKDLSVLKSAVANIGSDAAAVLPKSMEIEFVEAMKAAGGERLYEGAAVYLDKQVSKAVLGQTMTADDGSSQSQAKVHDEVRGDIRDSDALQLAATINRDLVRAFVDLNWGPQAKYPTFKFITAEPDDLTQKSIRDGNLSKNSGVRFSQKYYEREYGFQPGDIVSVGTPAQETDAAAQAAGLLAKKEQDKKDQAKKALNSEGSGDNTEFFLDQEMLDKFVAGITTPAELQKLMAGVLKPVFDLVEKGSDLQELYDELPALFPEMDSLRIEQILTRVFFVASVWGRISAEMETEE